MRFRLAAPFLLLLVCVQFVPAADPPPLFYAVISDTQRPDDDPLPEFAWAVERVNAISPACVLFPGDLTNTATQNQYEHFTAVADRLEVPIHYAVGNHGAVPGEDVYRDLFQQAVGVPTWYHEQIEGWHVVTLDSVRFVEGELQHDGIVDAEQLDWLRSELESIPTSEPIILMEHHPIAIEHDGLQNADEVLALFDGHYLAYTLTGHFHRNAVMTDDTGLLHLITGSLSFSLEKAVREIGYRLVSTVGRDMWTCWIEHGDDPSLDVVDIVEGPGDVADRWSGGPTLGTPIPNDSRLALRVGYVGEGFRLKCGARILGNLPASTEAADALVVLSEKNSLYLAEQESLSLTVKPDGPTHLSHITICASEADWEHFTLPSP